MKSLRSDPQEIARTLGLLFREGDVVELRIPKTEREGTVSGYFTDHAALAKQLAARNGDAAVYVTLNPVVPSLLARCANRVRPRARTTTSDKDTACRRWLLIDCDPTRPSEISSSDAEHDAALERARDIRMVLREEGWPSPVLADSGNGAHLLYRIDLPNDDAATWLLENSLKALAARFDDAEVKIDQGVFNASRVVKAYGTVARKGDDVPERPHRISRIIDVPPDIEVVQRELLKELTAPVQRAAPTPAARPARTSHFDIDAFLARHLQAREPVAHDGGRKWVLEACPFNADHKAPDAAIFERADGSLGFKCFHNSCSGLSWKDVRERFEGPREPRSSSGTQPQQKQTPKVRAPEFQSGRAVYDAKDPATVPVVDDLVFPGLTLLAARPKLGKSWLTLQMGIAVATGTPLAGWLTVKQGRVLYLALEEPRQRTTARMHKLNPDEDKLPLLDNIRFIYKALPLLGGGAEELCAALEEWPADLVVIDTVRAFSPPGGKRSDDIVGADYQLMDRLRRIAEKFKTAIVGVDHARKMPGDVVDSLIGTTGRSAGCDALIGMTRAPSGDVMMMARGREHEELSYSMRFNKSEKDFGWSIYAAGDEAILSEERQEIVELLRHEEPLTPAKIALLLHKNANTVRVLLSRMVSDGRIVKQGKAYVLRGF